MADIESLVEPAFDAPRLTVEFEPGQGIEVFRRTTGEQLDRVGLFAIGHSHETGGLGDEGEVGTFGSQRGTDERSDFVAAFVELATGGYSRVGAEVVAGTGGFFLMPTGGESWKGKSSGGSSMSFSKVRWMVDWLSLTVKR